MCPVQNSDALAASITKEASQQTYYTVKGLVDRDLTPEAYRAYAYFRWVDDRLDENGWTRPERLAFVNRQQALVDRFYAGRWVRDLSPEERMLARLIQVDSDQTGGLHAYIRNMMAVMAFDAERRDRWISQAELTGYAHALATAVTEALHYFIGHTCPAPRVESRYLAATGAHITHMLRDTHDDIRAGYFNIPREILATHGITPFDMTHDAYRTWVKHRVQQARTCFKAGKAYLAQVEHLRCRVAGYAYIARFEWVLDTIERDGYLIQDAYPERKSWGVGLKMAWGTLAMALTPKKPGHTTPHTARRPVRPSGGNL